MREPRFLIDGSHVLFSAASTDWLQYVVGGRTSYIPGEFDTPQSLEFIVCYAAKLLRERRS